MKKNVMMRVASALLVAVLLTTCAISGTFARYVSEKDAGDSARVAKWGVTVAATGDEAFTTEYENGSAVVTVKSDDKVVAPGTDGDLGGLTISGKSEVMVDVTATATLTLTGWVVDGDEYCPLVFTVGSDEYKIETGTAIEDIDELKAAVEGAFTALAETAIEPGTNFNKTVAVSWAWPISVDDAKDTALGTAGTATINFTCEASATQVD